MSKRSDLRDELLKRQFIPKHNKHEKHYFPSEKVSYSQFQMIWGWWIDYCPCPGRNQKYIFTGGALAQNAHICISCRCTCLEIVHLLHVHKTCTYMSHRDSGQYQKTPTKRKPEWESFRDDVGRVFAERDCPIVWCQCINHASNIQMLHAATAIPTDWKTFSSHALLTSRNDTTSRPSDFVWPPTW